VGTAINYGLLCSDTVYRRIAVKQFNSITAENDFKPECLHPEPLFYDWAPADSIAKFCAETGKRLHGHTLLWHKQLPPWMTDFQGNAADWEEMLRTHIHTIVSHYKGKVLAWDVVNEAFDEDGTLSRTIWLEHIGPDYIEKAFRFAHEADPDALLFYNDFNLESNSVKRSSAISFLNDLKNKGVQVDGIGLQMHISISYPSASQIATALQEIAEAQFRVHISELDISVNPDNKDIELTDKLLAKQADLLEKIVTSYNQLLEQYRYGITFWGITDKYSWLRSFYKREDYPLLYDDNYEPKPCYCKLKEVL
jgi:endo-1,4-beta-xylanase